MNYGKALLIFSSMLNYYFPIHSDETHRIAIKAIKLCTPYTIHESRIQKDERFHQMNQRILIYVMDVEGADLILT